MKSFVVTTAALTVVWLCSRVDAQAQLTPVLQPGDPILAIDFDTVSNSSYPPAESPENVLDANPASKYLNFAGRNTGFIVTPAVGPRRVQSLVLTTANDAPDRDPSSWALFGTDDPIVSADNSDGQGENWTLIDSGPVSLPDVRLTVGPVVPVVNSATYTSYRLVFPTLKAGPLMQVARVYFFESTDGTGPNVLAPGDSIRAIHLPSPQSSYPVHENPGNALDGDPGRKYLNFGKENSGFIVTPAFGPSVVKFFQFTTANDAPSRDPAGWALYGTDEPIMSSDNSTGMAENWTLIDEGTVELPLDRFAAGPLVPVANDTAYNSYRMVITALRETDSANSVQYSGIQFFEAVLPSLSIRREGGNVVIEFGGVLQSATNVAGPYDDVPDATSPHTLSLGSLSGSEFFRARSL